ncbi:MAG: DegT/DnrJ/EryC1/StrS family aminotransferase [Deltaproteobacteria bacterium]|nr:DegT/DnrJ/EryC1/StrS family aminotransferase [Deltaproteobacteria bacterium]
MDVKVPYVDIARQHSPLKQELLEAVARVIDHGNFILGPEVIEFESHFADLCGVRHAVGVNSGTDALVLALKVLGVGPGDEVITVPNSFVATVSAVKIVGATPVLVDVRDDLNMDPAMIEAALTPRTKVILPVHLTGRSCDMDAVLRIAEAHRLRVVEDCAQAVLAEHRGRRVGSLGTIGCFSLHPLKTLNACGDGGILTTSDPELAERLRVERNIGLKTREDCVAFAGNSRLDTMQAAMLLVKLRHLETWTQKRRRNAHYYQEQLRDIPGLMLPLERDGERCVYHTFVIQAERRDELKTHLESRGIGTSIHYPIPIHLQTAGQSLGHPAGAFPVAERQARRILSLPIYPELATAQLDHVVTAIRDFYRKGARQ